MTPICKPVVNTQLQRMNGLQRAAESFRYVALSIEFWMSPDGHVREWIRCNTRLAVLMAIPVFLTFPVITIGLWELNAWVNALTSITGKLIVLPILSLLVLISVAIVLRIISASKR